MSSSIPTKQIDGDVAIGRNVTIGGKATVRSSMKVAHNLTVEGWLEAKNIKGPNKGLFKTAQQLREAYPNPHEGWWALVSVEGSEASDHLGQLYQADGGTWVARVDSSGNPLLKGNPTVECKELTQDVEELSGDLEAVKLSLQEANKNISINAHDIGDMHADVVDNSDRIGVLEDTFDATKEELSGDLEAVSKRVKALESIDYSPYDALVEREEKGDYDSVVEIGGIVSGVSVEMSSSFHSSGDDGCRVVYDNQTLQILLEVAGGNLSSTSETSSSGISTAFVPGGSIGGGIGGDIGGSIGLTKYYGNFADRARYSDMEFKPKVGKLYIDTSTGTAWHWTGTELVSVRDKAAYDQLLQTLAEKAEKTELTDAIDGVKTKVQGGEWLPLRQGEGENSIVEGGNNASNTNIEGSHVEGYGNVIRDSGVAKGCHAEGRYVMPVNSAILLVGVGGRTGAETNAYVVTYNYGQSNNGYMYVLGVGGYNGGSDVRSAKSLQEVIKDHETDIAKLKTIDTSQYSTTEEIKKNLATGEWLPLQKGEGENSIACGNNCSATGPYAFASGLSTQASGMYSHAEGVFSVASGNYSHAEGSNAKPKGEYSHAEGERTEIASQGGHAEGVCTYLNANEDVIHHVGVGYYNDKLSTDVILRKYGDAKNGYQYIIGIGNYNGKDITNTTKSLQEVIKELGDSLAKVTLDALADRQNIANNTTAIATANTAITANTTAINTTNTRVDSATTRITSVESSLNAMNATSMAIITTGGSADEPVPVWTDSTRHDITLKKRTQTFTDFTDIDVSSDLNAGTDAAARLRDRRSWISSLRLRNFSGTKLTRAFMYCGGLRRLDTSTWEMGRVTTLRSTFHGCVQLEDLDTSHWDTHAVTDLGYTFFNCVKMRSFDVRAWDTSAVTSMDGTFNTCTSIEELDLSGWDTSQVQTVDSMFNNCGSLRRLDIRYWNLSRCSSADWFLGGCGAIEELYLGEGIGKVLNAAGTIDFSALTKWTGDSVQTLLNLFNRTAHSSEGFRAITLKLSSQTKAALGTAGIQTLTSRGYTIA